MRVRTLTAPAEAKDSSAAAHPLERQRELRRAVVAAKTRKIYARPFLDALAPPHTDAVSAIALLRPATQAATTLVSAGADGELHFHNLRSRAHTAVRAHAGQSHVAAYQAHNTVVSVGHDKTVKLWRGTENVASYASKFPLCNVDHHFLRPLFATASTHIDVYDHTRAEPIHTFSWGAETVSAVRFNRTERDVFASAGSDRTITLYDLRMSSPLSKVVLEMRTNAIAWNPMEAFNFTVANENHNCYTFDMRRLDRATNVLKDHVSAVMDLDYSPTGAEIVTASYDRTVRIFDARKGHSRDMYHTKRMQRVFAVKFSLDGKFIFSGSDDGNVRIWKTDSSAKLGRISTGERIKNAYGDKLIERYQHVPEMRKIMHRQLPKAVSNAMKEKHIIVQSMKRREENARKHASGATERKAERKKQVVTTMN